MTADLAFAPKKLAKTFSQAVAAIWITHLVFHLTDNHLAIGRFDQHAWPYLESDLAKGAVTPEKTQEKVDSFS